MTMIIWVSMRIPLTLYFVLELRHQDYVLNPNPPSTQDISSGNQVDVNEFGLEHVRCVSHKACTHTH